MFFRNSCGTYYEETKYGAIPIVHSHACNGIDAFEPCVVPLKVNINPGLLTCIKSERGYEIGWTLDVYDGDEKLLGSLRCKDGKLRLLKADVK